MLSEERVFFVNVLSLWNESFMLDSKFSIRSIHATDVVLLFIDC